MTLKRSISKKVKNTLARTKRLVSPSIGAITSPSSSSRYEDAAEDDDSLSSGVSTASWDLSSSAAQERSTHSNEPFAGLGIFRESSTAASSPQQHHTPTNSISSIQKSVSHIISAARPSLNSISTNEHSIAMMPSTSSTSGISAAGAVSSPSVDLNHQPTLLYSGRRKSSITRRSKSIQQVHSLDFIDTSLNTASNTTINPTTHIPTPNSFPNCKDYFHDAVKDNSSQSSYHKNDEEDEILLLPIDPVDKSKPPCTTEQLTPILPLSLNSSFVNGGASGNGSSYFDINPNDKPPLIVSNLSSATSTTLGSSFAESNVRGTPTSSTASPIRITLSASNFKPEEIPLELIQPDVNPIFAKSYQIDHLAKELDPKKKDRLADQMALNILQHITEENVDELSKLKEEISMKF